MIDFAIRRLHSDDSLDDLTSMLHRAFEPMRFRGLNCQSVDQTTATTRLRIGRGDCFVAVADRRLVGTITLQVSDPSSAIRRYRAPDVASVHQFAVDPTYQGAGIGHSLLQIAATWARARQFTELALDTPAPASELRDYYARQGFRLTGLVQLVGRCYESAVMAKPVRALPRSATIYAWPTCRLEAMPAAAPWVGTKGLRRVR